VNIDLDSRADPAEKLTVRTLPATGGFKIETQTPDPAQLDRCADFWLQHGYQKQAERLAHRAAELREARP
jgi:hypothetical protein